MALFALAAGFVVLALLYQGIASRLDERRLPPPGRLVDAGGHYLHLHCVGRGRPPVVFESGIGASSISWHHVQREVAEATAACTYDRAGLGWSEPCRRASTAGEAARQLEIALAASGLEPPFLLVGHSFGGYVLQVFACRHPRLVGGLVLLDPITWPEWRTPDRARRRALAGGAFLARVGAILASLGIVRLLLTRLQSGATAAPKAVLGFFGHEASRVVTRLVIEVAKMPRETWPAIRAHWSRPKGFLALARHLEALPHSAVEVETALASSPRWSFPVIVLTSDSASPSQVEWQAQLAAQSADGRQAVVPASHWIQLDRPDLVVQAIRELTTRA
jgi:pimeloyl-ACP methyl ester carboxylesterase